MATAIPNTLKWEAIMRWLASLAPDLSFTAKPSANVRKTGGFASSPQTMCCWPSGRSSSGLSDTERNEGRPRSGLSSIRPCMMRGEGLPLSLPPRFQLSAHIAKPPARGSRPAALPPSHTCRGHAASLGCQTGVEIYEAAPVQQAQHTPARVAFPA
jgi:hypothetical protein